MPDPTNDINEADLTALVAERNALNQRVVEQDADIISLVAERDALKQRVAELEARANPVYITDGQRVESIDLRERLVCAALTGLAAHPSDSHPMHSLRQLADYSVTAANLTLAAMRKGDSGGK